MFPILQMISAVLSMSHNQGAQKAGGLVNSAGSFIRFKKPIPKDPLKDDKTDK